MPFDEREDLGVVALPFLAGRHVPERLWLLLCAVDTSNGETDPAGGTRIPWI
jgi:hypothetical protein